MLHGRPVAILGGVRIPFCKQNTAYADVGNLGMSVRTLGALVEKYGLHGQQLGEVALGAVIKHSSDWNLGREATLSSGLSPLTPTSIWPVAILLAMCTIESSEVPHARWSVMPGVSGDRPDDSVASRPRFQSLECLMTAPSATSPSCCP